MIQSNAILEPIPKVTLLPTPKLLIGGYAFGFGGAWEAHAARATTGEEPGVDEEGEEDCDDDLGVDEGAQDRGNGSEYRS